MALFLGGHLRISALRADIPWKPLSTDAHGRCIHPRPTARGTLTAIVVGDGSPTHTDRDHRVRVQFPWQRGSQAASRSPHPSGSDNAPAGHALGVWLRVMSPVAGGNWGGHLVPRPGQEVLVAFQNGNIDRPLIIGAAYNGSGQTDVAGNCLGSGTQQASPNAPAFFAGQSDRQHSHQASLSGLKTQQLATSRNGQGGHNHLVFDDTPGESRIELGTTQYQSHLQLGHLKQQTGNARQADRGHGTELKTQASLALRAGNGLYLSTDARPHASGAHLDSGEAIAQTEDAQRLSQSLAAVAAQQNAALQGDPAADPLPAIDSLQHANQETGIHLHAASGSVSLQSQSGKTTAAADKKVTLASTTGNLNASAKQKILATAQGAYLKIEGGNIELHAPGRVEFKASMKSWTGPKSASIPGAELPQSSLNLKKNDLEISLVDANGNAPASESLLLNIQGEKRDTSAAGGTAILKDVLPGLLSGKQGNRKS